MAIAERLGDSVSRDHRRRLAEAMATVYIAVNDFRRTGDADVRAAGLSEEPARRALNLARAGHGYLWGHHYEEARAATTEALSVAETCGAEAARSIALTNQMLELLSTEGTGGGPEAIGRNASLAATRSGDDEAIATALSEEAIVAEMRGEYRRAIGTGPRAIEPPRHELPKGLA